MKPLTSKSETCPECDANLIHSEIPQGSRHCYLGFVKKLKVMTQTGSVYLIGIEDKTWQRVGTTNKSGYVRTDGGEYRTRNEPEVGHALTLVCDPLPGTSALLRTIITSDVISIASEYVPAPDHGLPMYYYRTIGIYDMEQDRTVAYRCPDCGHESGR